MTDRTTGSDSARSTASTVTDRLTDALADDRAAVSERQEAVAAAAAALEAEVATYE